MPTTYAAEPNGHQYSDTSNAEAVTEVEQQIDYARALIPVAHGDLLRFIAEVPGTDDLVITPRVQPGQLPWIGIHGEVLDPSVKEWRERQATLKEELANQPEPPAPRGALGHVWKAITSRAKEATTPRWVKDDRAWDAQYPDVPPLGPAARELDGSTITFGVAAIQRDEAKPFVGDFDARVNAALTEVLGEPFMVPSDRYPQPVFLTRNMDVRQAIGEAFGRNALRGSAVGDTPAKILWPHARVEIELTPPGQNAVVDALRPLAAEMDEIVTAHSEEIVAKTLSTVHNTDDLRWLHDNQPGVLLDMVEHNPHVLTDLGGDAERVLDGLQHRVAAAERKGPLLHVNMNARPDDGRDPGTGLQGAEPTRDPSTGPSATDQDIPADDVVVQPGAHTTESAAEAEQGGAAAEQETAGAEQDPAGLVVGDVTEPGGLGDLARDTRQLAYLERAGMLGKPDADDRVQADTALADTALADEVAADATDLALDAERVTPGAPTADLAEYPDTLQPANGTLAPM